MWDLFEENITKNKKVKKILKFAEDFFLNLGFEPLSEIF